MADQGADVFVSYKAEDRARLRPLVDALEAEGFSVWWDAQIGGGTNWHKDIELHLDAAKCVLVAWTKHSVGDEGHFVRDEARRAQRRHAYLPVCLDPVEPPLGFGEIQALSLKGWHGDRSDRRFVALVDSVRKLVTGDLTRHSVRPGKSGISRRRVIGGGIGIGALATAIIAGWMLFKPARANARRIAVLPFANLSGDPTQAYFSEGISEELRSALSRVGLQVIGRNSCDAVKDLDIKTAASRLGVANVLTGSVRRSPETIRIEAQLVDGSDGVERWAQSYDRTPGDTIKIQTDIAANVAQALSIALGQAAKAALTLGGTVDSGAQDLILKSRQLGREAATAESDRQRLALADAALARDPNYADAYVERSNALFYLAVNFAPTPAEVSDQLAQALAASRKAIAIAPRLGSAHSALANVAQGRLDFAKGLAETDQSLALSPDDPEVLGNGSVNVARLRSPEEGIGLLDRGLALDPLNGRFYRYRSEVLIYLRRFQEAINAGRKALELAPASRGAHTFMGDAFLLFGQVPSAKAEYEAIGTDSPFRLARLALLAARTGDRAGAQQMVAQLRRQYGPTSSYQYAEIYTQLGDSNEAFAELDNAITAKDAGLAYLKVDPFLDFIRNDQRYAALLKRLNFP